MQLRVTFLTTKTLTLDVEPSERIEELKQRLQEEAGIPSDMQRLIAGGRELREGGSLADHLILEDARMYLVRRLGEE